MSVLSKVTRRQLSGNRTRTAVTVIGMILSVAMITAVTTLMTSLYDYGVRAARDARGNWYAKFGASNSTVMEKIASDERVSEIFYMRYDGCELIDPSMTSSKSYIAVSAVSSNFFENMELHLTAGRLPENGSEMVVPTGNSLKIGTTVTVNLGERMSNGCPLHRSSGIENGTFSSVKESWEPGNERTYIIVGTYKPNRFEKTSNPCYNYLTVIEGDTIAEANAGGRRADIFIRTYKPMDSFAVYDELTSRNSPLYANDSILADSETHSDLLRYYDINRLAPNTFVILGALALAVITVGSVLMISNAFMISASERRRQFGLLSSVGATAKQIRKCVFLEGMYLLAFSLPIGILLGIGTVGIGLGALRGLVLQVTGNKAVTFRLYVSALSLAVSALIGTVTVFISALRPAHFAAKSSAIDLVHRSTDDTRLANAGRKSAFGIIGKIVRNYDKRDRRRRRSTVMSLSLSVMLFLLTCSLALSMRSYLSSQGTSRGDVWVYYSSRDATRVFDLYRECTEGSGIIKKKALNAHIDHANLYADSTMLAEAALSGDGSPTRASILVLDDDSYLAFLETAGLSRAELYDTDSPVAIGICGRQYRTEDYSPYLTSRDFTGVTGEIRYGLGYRVETATGLIMLDDGTAEPPGTHYPDNTLILAAVTDAVPWGENHTSSYPRLIISEKTLFSLGVDTYMRHAKVDAYLSCLTDRHNELTEDLQHKLDTARDIGNYHINDELDGQDTGRSRIVIVTVLSYGLTLLMTLVAAANVMNTISSGVSMRTRDLSVLRSLGMSDKSFAELRITESLRYSFKAAVPAIITSVALMLAFGRFVPSVMVVIPWSAITGSVIAVFLIVILTEKAAFSRIMKKNAAEEMRKESV